MNAVLAAGTWTLQVVFAPNDTTDFTNATATVQIVVGTTGSVGISGFPVYSSGDCCFFNQPTPYTITVSGSTAASDRNSERGLQWSDAATGTLTPGSGTSSTATLNLISSYFFPGNNNVTLNYLGDDNYIPGSASGSSSIAQPGDWDEPAAVGGDQSRFKFPTSSLWQEP